MEYLPFNKIFLEDLKFYPFPECPKCGDKLVFYKYNGKYGLKCRSECSQYSESYKTLPIMIRKWNNYCADQLSEYKIINNILKFIFFTMFIYFILVFIFNNPLIMLLTLISPILLIFHEQITLIYMKYKINKHKKYIESLDKITYHKGGFVLPQHIPLKFSSDINITDIERLREELSKVDYDTTELNNTLDKLEILIKLKK